jgi:peptidoglycan/xylan/chitin deacetylase (PgdA/CDA1 family)
MARGEPLPDMSCLVTFDDGWRDNVEHALPILRATDMPATVFVAVDYIGSQTCFWQERLNRLLFRAARQGGEPRRLAETHVGAGAHSADDRELRRRTRAAVSRMKKTCGESQIAEFEAALDRALSDAGAGKASWGDDAFMNWKQVVELTRDSRVSAAAHGCSHTPLTALDPQTLSAELTTSRRRIGEELGREVDAIAYPNGNYDDAVIAGTRAAGYRIGFTTDKGLVTPGDDPLRLRRINIHEGATATVPEFLCAMLQIFHRLRRS